MEIVESSQRRLEHAPDFEGTHLCFDGRSHSTRRSIGFGHEDTDQFTAAALTARALSVDVVYVLWRHDEARAFSLSQCSGRS
eukprot:1534422-Pleurochrysis_carterae.AAC.1